MRRVGACMIVAACGGGTGIALEVTAPSGTENVELFMGNALVQKTEDNRAMCSSDMPDLCVVRPVDPLDPARRGFEVGHGWLGMATTSTRGIATDGVYGFSLEPDAEKHIPALLLVGLDGNEMPTGYALLHDLTVDSSPELMKIKLSPTSPTDRVQVWRRFGDDTQARSACAVIEKTADNALEWFVPADDTDCDNALPADPSAGECYDGAWTYCGHFPGDVSKATCAVRSSSGSGNSCRWAGPECVDQASQCGSGSLCTETAQVACFPPEVCEQIGSGCNTFDASSSATCAPKALSALSLNSTSSGVPWLSCTFLMESPTKPCNGVWPTIESFDTAVLTLGTPCLTLELAKFGLPVTLGDKVPANGVSDIEIAAVNGCVGSELRLTVNSTGAGLEGEALLGIITTDYKRRYIRLHQDVYFAGCQAGSNSYCGWKGPQGPLANYSFTCN